MAFGLLTYWGKDYLVEIKNTSKRPLKVPLPGGKTLFLGPGAKGNVSDKASDHPPLEELVESGTIEVLGSGRSKSGGESHVKTEVASSSSSKGGPGMRRSGDR